MPITRYKVIAGEIGGTEQAYGTEVALDSSNVYFPSSSYVNTDNVQDAINLAAKVVYTYATQTSSRSTSSSSFTDDSTLSSGVTPIAGTYLVLYSVDATANQGLLSAASGEIAIFSGGSVIAESVRGVSGNGDPRSGPISITIITLNGSTTVKPRFRLLSGNSLALGASSFSLLRLSFT